METIRPQTEQLRSRPYTAASVKSKAATSIQRLAMATRPGFIINQRVPDLTDIAFWQGRITKCKAFKSEEAVTRGSLSRSYNVPHIALHKTKTGENLGPKWFPQEAELPLYQQTNMQRFGLTTRPDTYQKIFPTAAGEYHKLPATSSERWSVVDMKRDEQLANYGLTSKNAFKTYWMKHHTLRNRKFFNTAHPEYEDQGIKNHRRKDEIVDYRESMLGVKDMMTTIWKGKK